MGRGGAHGGGSEESMAGAPMAPPQWPRGPAGESTRAKLPLHGRDARWRTELEDAPEPSWIVARGSLPIVTSAGTAVGWWYALTETHAFFWKRGNQRICGRRSIVRRGGLEGRLASQRILDG